MILVACPNPSIDTYAWIDCLEAGKVNRISKQKEYPGGKGVHIALALRELKGEAQLLGNWAGKTGEWIKSECELAGIKSIGPELSGGNRKCYTFRSEDPNVNNTELLEPGPTLDETNFKTFLTIFEDNIQAASLACLSGSWPKDSPNDAYLQLIRIAARYKKPVILDCSGVLLEKSLTHSFFGLHLNEHEAEAVCGTNDFKALVNNLKDKVRLIALTKGKEGLLLYYNNKMITANVMIGCVVSTVGSGDCLTAGMAYAVSRDMDIADIARYGVACGAANCMREDLGMFYREDMEQLLPKVKVSEYK